MCLYNSIFCSFLSEAFIFIGIDFKKSGFNVTVLVLLGNRFLIFIVDDVNLILDYLVNVFQNLYYLSLSIVFISNSYCIDGLLVGLSGLGEVLFSWKGVFVNLNKIK